MANPIRWHRDLAPVRWVVDALGAATRVTGWVPPGYEAYARLFHASERRPAGSLPLAQRRALVELLRDETTTPEQCWFCFADRHRILDDQGVTERVEVPRGRRPQLVTGGPLELALVPPPEKPLRLALPAGNDPRKLVEAMTAQLGSHFGPSVAFFFKVDASTTRADVEERARKLTDESFLGDVSPSFWWPDDRRWFVATPESGPRRAFPTFHPLPARPDGACKRLCTANMRQGTAIRFVVVRSCARGTCRGTAVAVRGTVRGVTMGAVVGGWPPEAVELGACDRAGRRNGR